MTMAEKRLIYAEDLFEPVDQKVFMMRGRSEGKPAAMFGELFRKRVEMAPTVDAVEVVRCKDCAWCHPEEDLNYCENPNAPWIDDPDFDDITVAENDFCSFGERRTDG